MSGELPWQKLLGVPLKEVTRKERQALLGVSVVALAIAKTGILPSRIESIGIELPAADKPTVLLLVAAIVTYFVVAFAVYAVADFVAWQRPYYELVERLDFEEARRRHEAEEAGATNVIIGIEPVSRPKEAWKSILRGAIAPTSVIRALVEFFLPIAVGLFALVSLLRAAAQ